MRIEQTGLDGCFIVHPRVFEDERGYFYETFNEKDFFEATGLDIKFVQDNESQSSKGVLRGLHFQVGEYAQAKLVRVIKGGVLDVCVDLRPESATYKEWFSILLDDRNKKQLFVPKGFAHGFLVMEDNTVISYKCDQFYNKEAERGIIYNDPTLNINWNISDNNLILSTKDRHLPELLKQHL